MNRYFAFLILVAFLAFGCRGTTNTSQNNGNGNGEENPPVKNGNSSSTNGGHTTTDPGKIYDPTLGFDTDREEVAKMDMNALIASLADEELAPAATDELATRGSQSVPPLIKALEDDDEATRQRAIFTLGRLGPLAKAAIPLLQKIADDNDSPLQADAKFAIDAIEGK